MGTTLNGTSFTILSICLVCTVLPLLYALHKLSKKEMSLTKEVKMLTAIFFIFTLAYVSRTVYDFTASLSLEFKPQFIGFVMPIFWDIVPICLMLLYHLKASYF